MNKVVEKLNQMIPAEYPRLLRLENTSEGDYIAYMDNKTALCLPIKDHDYLKHLYYPLEVILFPRIMLILMNGIVYD